MYKLPMRPRLDHTLDSMELHTAPFGKTLGMVEPAGLPYLKTPDSHV